MALNKEKQQIFDRRIAQMRADKFFLPSPRELSGDTRYLFISYGGTGVKALFGVKKKFEEIIPAAQLREQIRFLAIDTDAATQKQTKEEVQPDGTTKQVEIASLRDSEFYQLPGNAARNFFNGTALPVDIQSWINPKLEENINADNRLLNGKGASGIRQLGRLTLYPANTVNELTTRIQTLANELTRDTNAPLHVFILTGIAGGTGSGTLIDLSYLIRHTISSMPAFLNRAVFNGFIMLPSTGSSTVAKEIQHGNRNGYAALKELNHFMTLKKREDVYRFSYGNGLNVESYDNIFDTCYLMEGVADGIAFSKPMERVTQVLSESLLDMITTSQVRDEHAEGIQRIGSFMNDEATFRGQMIGGIAPANAPRDADYIYCALGHNEFSMPSNEIKAYVAKQMFDKIYALFKNCGNVEDEDAEEFVKAVNKRGAQTESACKRAVNAELEPIFRNLEGRKGGPYYVINLLKRVIDVEIPRLRRKIISFMNRETLDNIEKEAARVNNQTFNVFVAAMEAMKSLMDDQFGTVVETRNDRRHYSFMPVSLGNMANANCILDYLGDFLDNRKAGEVTRALLNELLDNQEAWVSLVDPDQAKSKEGADAMRKFWNTKLDALINYSMENFLIKYYAQDKNAHYDEKDHDNTVKYLDQAANGIYNHMLGAGGKAQPMVYLTSRGLDTNDLLGHTYLMVPQTAPHLRQALERVAEQQSTANNQVKVCTSFATDTISCFRQYSSIPAFKLAWAQAAEKAYEEDIRTANGYGTHISETIGGKLWINFPSLLPRSTWEILNTPHSNEREAKLANSSVELFENAKALGLTTGEQATATHADIIYTVKVLPAELRPSEELFKKMDILLEDSAERQYMLDEIDNSAQECANKLFAKVAEWSSVQGIPRVLEEAGVSFASAKLQFAQDILSFFPHASKPEDWDEKMAKDMLRKLPDTMNELNSTILVMQKLKAMVEKKVKSSNLLILFTQYLATGMFTYNEKEMTWNYTDGDGIGQELVFLEGQLEKDAQYYFMFCSFRDNADAIEAALAKQFSAYTLTKDTPRAERTERNQLFLDKGKELREEVIAWINSDPMEDHEEMAKRKRINTKSIRNFYNALLREAKFMEKNGYLDLTPQEEPQVEEDDAGTPVELF